MKLKASWVLMLVCVVASPIWGSAEPIYKNPFDIDISPDGRVLLVACSGSDSVIAIDALEGSIIAEIAVGDFPSSVRMDPSTGLVLVTNRDSDSLMVLDVDRREIVADIAVGWAPMDALVNHRTGHVLVANSQSRDVSVVELDREIEIKRLKGGQGPRRLEVARDGELIYLANLLPNPHPPDLPPVPELTVIDAEREVVAHRVGLDGANLVYGLDTAPDGRVLLALSRPKNLLPLIQVAGGWTMTSGLGLVGWEGVEERPSVTASQLMLDSLNRHYAEPSDVAADRAGYRAAITAAGADQMVIVDLNSMWQILADSAQDPALLADRLDLSHRYLRGIAPTGSRPVAVVLSPDGARAYSANRLDDSVTVIDMTSADVLATFDLGGAQEITPLRRGERLFFSAAYAFNNQISCGSCHPDANQDGLVYDISPDGLGRNFVDTRTMLGVGGTEPFKWSGLNPDLHRQCGPRAATFINRTSGFDPEQLDDVVAFMESLTPPRNRRLSADGRLNALQAWGKEIFERTIDNNGDEIPQDMQCNLCHSGERFTNRMSFDVGTGTDFDKSGNLDTPSLNHLSETAPYLHDGRALTLEELWTVFSPEDTHGRALDLSKDELNALVEYLKCL